MRRRHAVISMRACRAACAAPSPATPAANATTPTPKRRRPRFEVREERREELEVRGLHTRFRALEEERQLGPTSIALPRVISYVGRVGVVAQLGERELCKLEVVGSIPSGSTNETLGYAEGFSFPRLTITSEFDFLGGHLRKRVSGPIWVRERKRVYFLHRWPSTRSMTRVRLRVKELTGRNRYVTDVRVLIDDLSPVLRGWGNYFHTGNATQKFTTIDSYVWQRLTRFMAKRKGTCGPMRSSTSSGCTSCSEQSAIPEPRMRRRDRSPVSRVPEIGMHVFKGILATPVVIDGLE